MKERPRSSLLHMKRNTLITGVEALKTALIRQTVDPRPATVQDLKLMTTMENSPLSAEGEAQVGNNVCGVGLSVLVSRVLWSWSRSGRESSAEQVVWKGPGRDKRSAELSASPRALILHLLFSPAAPEVLVQIHSHGSVGLSDGHRRAEVS